MWKKWVWTAVIAVIIIFLVPYSLPLIFAFLSAVMLEGIVQWIMTKFSFKRLQAVIGVFIGYMLMIGVIGYNLISIIAPFGLWIGAFGFRTSSVNRSIPTKDNSHVSGFSPKYGLAIVRVFVAKSISV